MPRSRQQREWNYRQRGASPTLIKYRHRLPSRKLAFGHRVSAGALDADSSGAEKLREGVSRVVALLVTAPSIAASRTIWATRQFRRISGDNSDALAIAMESIAILDHNYDAHENGFKQWPATPRTSHRRSSSASRHRLAGSVGIGPCRRLPHRAQASNGGTDRNV